MVAVVMEKLLGPVDVEHRLTFKTESLRYFQFKDGGNFTDFKVVDLTDQSIRDLRLIKRKQDHPKPVISKGWRAYAREKGLRVGDKVILRVSDGGKAPFSIQVQRTDIMVWGEPFWYDI